MIKRMVAADYTNLRRRTDEVVLRFDKRDDGWQLVQHTPRRLKDGASLEFVSFLKGDEPKISGEEMRRRAVKMGANFGQGEKGCTTSRSLAPSGKTRTVAWVSRACSGSVAGGA